MTPVPFSPQCQMCEALGLRDAHTSTYRHAAFLTFSWSHPALHCLEGFAKQLLAVKSGVYI